MFDALLQQRQEDKKKKKAKELLKNNLDRYSGSIDLNNINIFKYNPSVTKENENKWNDSPGRVDYFTRPFNSPQNRESGNKPGYNSVPVLSADNGLAVFIMDPVEVKAGESFIDPKIWNSPINEIIKRSPILTSLYDNVVDHIDTTGMGDNLKSILVESTNGKKYLANSNLGNKKTISMDTAAIRANSKSLNTTPMELGTHAYLHELTHHQLREIFNRCGVEVKNTPFKYDMQKDWGNREEENFAKVVANQITGKNWYNTDVPAAYKWIRQLVDYLKKHKKEKIIQKK